jgi:hypothetical protein
MASPTTGDAMNQSTSFESSALDCALGLIDPHRVSSIIARATIEPVVYVVTTFYRAGKSAYRRVDVLQGSREEAPIAEHLLKSGEVFLRSFIQRADSLEAMPADQRQTYREQYRELLTWRSCQNHGVERAEAHPWEDYDPISVDEEVQRWMHPGVRYAGD